MGWNLGYDGPVLLRSEHLGRSHDVRQLLYFSDFHLNRFSGKLVQRLCQLLENCRADLILLGGDYVDTRGGLPYLRQFLKSLPPQTPVFAIAGNHDYWFGCPELQAIFESQGVEWLENKSASIQLDGRMIDLDGSRPQHGDAGFRLLCLHQPTEVPPAYGYDLILAGHLHGSQVVLWEKSGALYPGRWFYRWNRIGMACGKGRCLISRGLGDTLPLRYNCPREVLQVYF